MPKSEFDSPLQVKGGRVEVTGTVEQPSQVHWMLVQGNVVARGLTDAAGTTFTDTEAHAQAWQDGPAQVSGVTVAAAGARLATFEWHQEVELKRG
jgi:hypothetical protein